MAHFFSEASRTFSEYLLLPNLTTKDCIPENVILRTSLVKFKQSCKPFRITTWQLPWRDRAGYPLFMDPKILKSKQQWSVQLKTTKQVLLSATQI